VWANAFFLIGACARVHRSRARARSGPPGLARGGNMVLGIRISRPGGRLGSVLLAGPRDLGGRPDRFDHRLDIVLLHWRRSAGAPSTTRLERGGPACGLCVVASRVMATSCPEERFSDEPTLAGRDPWDGVHLFDPTVITVLCRATWRALPEVEVRMPSAVSER